MKYFSHKIKYDGHTFDSKKECSRYIRLREMEKEGKIKNLQLQTCIEILPKQIRIEYVQLKTKIKRVEKVDEKAAHYHCDFMYTDNITGQTVIEEVKSPMTAMIRDYSLRRKLVKLWVSRQNDIAGREVYVFKEII